MSSKLDAQCVQLERAVTRLAAALRQPKDEFIRDSSIQRFEFSFELVWKTLKTAVEDRGLRVYSPKDALRAAFQVGLIDDDPLWLETVELRNRTTHVYSEAIAEEIYVRLPAVLGLYERLLARLKSW